MQKGRTIPVLMVSAITLGGCFGGEPSASDMAQALRTTPGMGEGLALMSGANLPPYGSAAAKEAMQKLLDGISVEKIGCAAAQGSPGYVCDYRITMRMPNGQTRQMPSAAKSRFFKASNGWQVSQQ